MSSLNSFSTSLNFLCRPIPFLLRLLCFHCFEANLCFHLNHAMICVSVSSWTAPGLDHTILISLFYQYVVYLVPSFVSRLLPCVSSSLVHLKPRICSHHPLSLTEFNEFIASWISSSQSKRSNLFSTSLFTNHRIPVPHHHDVIISFLLAHEFFDFFIHVIDLLVFVLTCWHIHLNDDDVHRVGTNLYQLYPIIDLRYFRHLSSLMLV